MTGRSRLLRAFWNPDQRRVRTPWRFVLTAVLFVAAGLLVAALVSGLARLLPSLVAANSPVVTAVGVVGTAVVVTVVVYVAGRAVDRRYFRDFGFRLDRSWWFDFGFGLALGFSLMTLLFLVELAAGWVRVVGVFVAADGRAFLPMLGYSLVTFLAVGFYEELLARGYLLTNVAEGLSGYVGDRAAVGVAVVVSSALFGLVHATNPNATLVSTATIALAGVFLALGYALTDELAIPVGLHISWNFAEGAVYGFPVSGTSFGASLVGTRGVGPAMFTGGPFGPEGGLVGVVAILLGCGCIAAWVRARDGPLAVHPGITRPELRWRDE